MKACVPRSRIYFTEDEYVRWNPMPKRRPPPTEDELRQRYRQMVARGMMPAPCGKCGLPHWPLEDMA